MDKARPNLVRFFGVTYVVLALALSYFAIRPTMQLGEPSTFLYTEFWMLVLAGIVTAYGGVVVLFGGEDHAPES